MSKKIAAVETLEIVNDDAAPRINLKTAPSGADELGNGGARARAVNAALLSRGALGASVKEITAICDAEHGAGAIKAISNHILHLRKRNLVAKGADGRYTLTSAAREALIEAGRIAPEVKAPAKKKTKKTK